MCHQSESSIIDHPKNTETYASEIFSFNLPLFKATERANN